MSKQKGFTILELIVVIAIMAIVSGIIIPVYNSMRPKIRLNGAARQLQGDLMWARMRAISENNDYAVTFGLGSDLSNNRYYIYDDNDGNFSTVGTETNELVRTGMITDNYKGVGYGFVAGTYITSGVSAPIAGTVTFSSSAAVDNTRWFKFEPTGRSNKAGSIYLIQDEGPTTTDSRKNRMSKITVIITGRIKLYNCHFVSPDWIWK